MKDFKIALVQHASPVGKKEKNLAATISWVAEAKKRGANLICFPELGITGHAGHPAMLSEAECVPGGPSVTKLCDIASKNNTYICAGIAENDLGIHYNTQFIVGPEGFVGNQRTIHLSGDAWFYFRGGTNLPVFELAFARVGIIICYDNQHPEISRCLALRGAEVLLAPHAARGEYSKKGLKAYKRMWTMIQSCRAYDNSCYTALCNTAGRSAAGLKGVTADHAGGCLVFDPEGDLIGQSKAKDVRDEMIVVALKAKLVAERRKEACFTLRTRRPEVFKILSEPSQ